MCRAPGWPTPRTVDRKEPVTAHKDLPVLLKIEKGREEEKAPCLQSALILRPVICSFAYPAVIPDPTLGARGRLHKM